MNITNKFSNKSVFDKFLYLSGASFSAIVIISYIAYLMGSEYFLLNGQDYGENILLKHILTFVFFMVNMFFVFSVTLDIYDKRIVKVLMAYVPIALLANFFIGSSLIVTTVFPFVYCLVVGKNQNKELTKVIKRYFVYFLAVMLYQLITMQVKLNVLNIGDNSSIISTAQFLFYSFDLILFEAWYYMMKGGKNYERKLDFHSHNISDGEISQEDFEAVNFVSSLKGWNKAKMMVVFMAIQISQLFIVMSFCLLASRGLEFAIILVMFWFTRKLIFSNKCFHANRVWICTSLSTLIFYAGSSMTIPLKYSMFAPVVIGMLIAYSLYLLSITKDTYEHTKKENVIVKHDNGILKEENEVIKQNVEVLQAKIKEFANPKPFKVREATEEEIKLRAVRVGLSDEKAQWLIDKFRVGKRYSELCMLGEEEASCRTRISRIIKKMEATT